MRIASLLIAVICSASVFAQKDIKKVEKSLSQEETKKHIEFLASDELRGRDTGSPGLEQAAQYIADRFKEFGLKTQGGSYFQEVSLVKMAPARQSVLTIDTVSAKHGEGMVVLRGEDGKINASLIHAGHGMEVDYNGLDVAGKVVVVEYGSPDDQSFMAGYGLGSEKVALAKKYGAVGVIELFKTVGMPWQRIVGFMNRESIGLDDGQDEASIPFIWLNDPRNVYLSYIKEESRDAQIDVKGMVRAPIPGKNVFGYVEGSDADLKDEFLIVTAHYDHVGVGRAVNGDSIYNGARDNAIGTVALINAAKFIARNPARRSVAFLAVTAEEKGMLGSSWYAENPMIPMDQVIFDLNCDGGGYNDTSLASVVGLERSTVDATLQTAVEDAGLKLGGDPAPEQGFFDRSDNVSFARKGVPCINMSPGLSSFDQEIMKYYHQPADEASSLDFEYLHKFNKAFVLTANRIANMDEAPFWLEGDKYEEAGKKLYSR